MSSIHFFAGVVIDPNETDIETAVAKAMAPHREFFSEAEDDYGGVWDWYQIGGRWTGVWSGYDPQTDPKNIEVCWLCNGTGQRTDIESGECDWCGGCNGCQGTGKSVKWSTEWGYNDGDIQPVSALLANHDWRTPHTVIAPDGPLLERDYDGEGPGWDIRVREFLTPYRDARLVVVDYHC